MIDMTKKFNRAVVFSGGGTRFSYYLGIYAALLELDRKPDLIIATCGGSIASAIIQAFPAVEDQKKFMTSSEFFDFPKNTRLTDQRSLFKLGWFTLKKKWKSDRAFFIEDVFNRYLVEMPQNLDQLLPSLKVDFANQPSTIVVGSQILFTQFDLTQKRRGRKLYQKVLFTDPKTKEEINFEQIKLKSTNYKNSAIAEEIAIESDISALDAMRISVSDMFYVSPVFRNQRYYAGGAIDLVPVELASSLAQEVIMENKQSYKSREEALVRSVMGFSANDRLEEIKNRQVDYWIDTRDASEALKGYYPEKRIDWKNLEIALNIPQSFSKFQTDMEKQWEYGYRRTLETFAR